MNNQLFNLRCEDIEKICVSKDIFGNIIGISIITKVGDKMVLKSSDLHDFPIFFERKFDTTLDEFEKVEFFLLKIQSIDIVERDELFRPARIKVMLDNGQIFDVDNKICFANDSIELLEKGMFELSFREMGLCEYFLINFAKKKNFTIGKLKDEFSFGSMLYREFIDEVFSIGDVLGDYLCSYFIDRLAIQENEDSLRVDEKTNYNGKLKSAVQYSSIKITEKDFCGTPIKVEIVFETGKKISVSSRTSIFAFIKELNSDYGISYNVFFNYWKNPNSKVVSENDGKRRVKNLNFNDGIVKKKLTFSDKIKSMSGFIKGSKSKMLTKKKDN